MLFSYRLAERLHMIRDEMMERMSGPEFYNWMAVFYLDEKRAAESSALKPARSSRQQTPEEISAAIKSFNR